MQQRKCVDLNYRVQNLNTLVENRVKSGKFDLAATFYKEANSIIANHPNCNIDSSGTQKLAQKYTSLFVYWDRLKELDILVRDEKYDTAVAQFISLSHYFAEHHLGQFGLKKPSLYTFVKGAESQGLSKEAAWYYIRNENFPEALRYLELLRKMDVPSGETKKLQQAVGRGIGYAD